MHAGYGFITPANGGDDIFVHQSAITAEGDSYRALTEGAEVEYELKTEDDGRTKAHNVTGPNRVPVAGIWGNERPLTGKVARWRDDRGFGFVTPDDGGDDVFVHQSCIVSSGFRALTEGETVEYSVVETDGKSKAGKVTGLGGRPVSGKGGGKGGGKGDSGARLHTAMHIHVMILISRSDPHFWIPIYPLPVYCISQNDRQDSPTFTVD